MVPKMETDIKTAEEALPLLPNKEDEVTKPKKPKYNLMECSIILEPLTEEMILKYTTAPFPPPKHSLRPLKKSHKSKFNLFKKHHEKFIKKKRGRKRKLSEEDSLSDPLSPEQVEENNKKKKKHGYEEDVDWSPPEDCNTLPPKPKQTKKSNLRLNPRRKRIESGSSEESEGGQKRYDTRRKCSDPSNRAFLGESSGDEAFFDFLEEEEVAYTKEESNSCADDPVSLLVTDIIDTVATMLDKPESVPKCRWCDTEISDALAILCPICKDMGHDVTIQPKKQRAKKQKNASNQVKKRKGKSGNSIVSKLRKMFPQQEMQQILYNSSKKPGEGKKFNHVRTKKTPKRPDLVKSVSSESFEEQLLKTSQATKANQAKQKAVKILKQKSLISLNKKSHKIVPEPDNTKMAANQPTNVQHGTYLLPTVPSVVVANYATSDAEKGDYFLSSIYYKNETTSSKVAVNNAVSNALVPMNNTVNVNQSVMSNAVKTPVHVNIVSAASKKPLQSLTVREIIHNQLQVSPVSRTSLNPQVHPAPRAPFLSNSSISLVPIAPKPPPSSNSPNQQVQITPVSNNLSMPSLSALVDSAPSVPASSSSFASPALVQTQLTATLSQPQLTATLSQPQLTATLSRPQLTATLSQPQLSATLSQPQLSATLLPTQLSMNPHMQISAFPTTVMSTCSPTVMQPHGSIVPATNMVGVNQNLQLIPISQPPMPVITKKEPDVQPNSLEEIIQEINPSLLITPISNSPLLAQANNVTQNAPVMGTELLDGSLFNSDGSLSENLLSSLPFNSDVSLIPTRIEELTNANFTGLLNNQGETSTEKEGQFGDQSGDDLLNQTALQATPMDTSLPTPEKSQSTDDSLENQRSLRDSPSRKKKFSPPDITESILASLKESMTMREKTLRELDAICIMCITDFDEDPKTSLLRFIESNRREQEELLQKPKSTNASEDGEEAKVPEEQAIEKKLQALERNANVYDIAWQYLKYHTSFQKYSDALLRTSRFMNVQIKKELIEQGEEEEASSCQFAKQNTNFQAASNPGQQLSTQQTTAINNILTQMQSQVNNLPNVTSYAMPGMGAPNMNMQYHGLSPVSASMGGDPSRETPSRGSGPRTPARPESALSQPEEILPLAPIQDSIPMQTVTYSQQNLGQPVNVQRININQPQTIRPAGTLQSGGQFQVHNTTPQTYQRMLVSMTQRQAYPPFQAQVRSSNGKVYNLMRVDPSRMIRPRFAVQNNFVPNTAAAGSNNQNRYASVPAAPNQNNYVGSVTVPVSLPNNYGSAVVPVSLQNTYGTTNVPVSLQNLTPGTTVVLQTGQPVQSQNRQPIENVDVSSLRCAVCFGVATLRCKQCSKVAYCNTTCAKKYWHSRHKIECLQLLGT